MGFGLGDVCVKEREREREREKEKRFARRGHTYLLVSSRVPPPSHHWKLWSMGDFLSVETVMRKSMSQCI